MKASLTAALALQLAAWLPATAADDMTERAAVRPDGASERQPAPVSPGPTAPVYDLERARVRLIVGGASKDAKAKVSDLPVRK